MSDGIVDPALAFLSLDVGRKLEVQRRNSIAVV